MSAEEDRVFFEESNESKIEDNTAKGNHEEINVDIGPSHIKRGASSGTTGDTCTVI